MPLWPSNTKAKAPRRTWRLVSFSLIAANAYLLYLEYAVKEGLVASKGDRPDVPNFVLVLTDGRATDDVKIGAPALRNHAYVVAVGVGKKIKENELKIIAGSEVELINLENVQII